MYLKIANKGIFQKVRRIRAKSIRWCTTLVVYHPPNTPLRGDWLPF